MRRIKVAVLFGGQSVEHEVSLLSAKNVVNALSQSKYEVLLIGISKQGYWQEFTPAQFAKLFSSYPSALPSLETPDLSREKFIRGFQRQIKTLCRADVVFPVLHGTFGEDGAIQGLLKTLGIPFVGADILGSAIGMDKDIQKRLLQHAGVPVANFQVVTKGQTREIAVQSYPVFVKPATSGSSVGVTKVHRSRELLPALRQAWRFDRKALIEEAIVGREIEVSVLEDGGNPLASLPGEIIPQGHEFYDYTAKYLDENGARLEIPAKLTAKQIKDCQNLAIKVFKILQCRGMARVDMFLTRKGIIINEINTIPGFTNISMYPKLWEVSGLTVERLVDKIMLSGLGNYVEGLPKMWTQTLVP